MNRSVINRITYFFFLIIIFSSLLGCEGKKKSSVIESGSEWDKVVFKVYPDLKTEAKFISPSLVLDQPQEYSSSSLVDSTLTTFTPKVSNPQSYAYPEALGLASNGDFWWFNKYCLFKANVKSDSDKYQCMKASEQLATEYIKDRKEGLYFVSDFDKASFVPYPDDKDNYIGFFNYGIMYNTAEEIGVVALSLILAYDSKNGTFEELLPFKSDYYIQTTVNSSAPKITYNIFPDQSILASEGLYYQLKITEDGKEKYYLIRYNPFENKHYLELARDDYSLFQLNCKKENTCIGMSYPSAAKPQSHPCLISIDGRPIEEVKNEVANCISENLSTKIISMAPMKKDITPYLITKEEAFKLFNIEMTKQNELYKIDPPGIYSSQETSITCNQTVCAYAGSFPIASGKIYVGNRYFFYVDLLTEDGTAMHGLYRVDLETKESTLISKNKMIETLDFTPGIDAAGDVLLYAINKPDASVMNLEYYLFSSQADKSFRVPSTQDQLINNPVMFSDLSRGKLEQSQYLSKDGKYAFFNISNAEDGSNYYYYLNIAKTIKEKTDEMNPTANLLAANPQPGQLLTALWKDTAYWINYSDKQIFKNNPFLTAETGDGSKNPKTPQLFSKKYAFMVAAGKVTSTTPPSPPETSLSISANVDNIFKCGGQMDKSLTCPFGQMCKEKECVNPLADIIQEPVAEGSNDEDDVSGTNETGSSDMEGGDTTPPETDVAECADNSDCIMYGDNFACVEQSKCLPKAKLISVTPGEFIIGKSQLTYPTEIKWEIVKDTYGNELTKYNLNVKYEDTGEIESEIISETQSVTVPLAIPGNITSRNITISLYPSIEGIDFSTSQPLTDQISITLTNNQHCMLTAEQVVETEDPNKCPTTNPSMLFAGFRYKCIADQCKKSPLTLSHGPLSGTTVPSIRETLMPYMLSPQQMDPNWGGGGPDDATAPPFDPIPVQ